MIAGAHRCMDALVAKRVAHIKQLLRRPPSLAVIRVGDDQASATFVRKKLSTAHQHGLLCREFHLPAEAEAHQIRQQLYLLNHDDSVDGILLQLPLPSHLDGDKYSLLQLIHSSKDVDGLHTTNVGQLMANASLPPLRPCTPLGIMHLLRHLGGQKTTDSKFLSGKVAVLVGCSSIVGKPLAMELLGSGCTVTLAHKTTPPERLEEDIGRADIVIVATGVPNLIPGHWIRPGSVVIDVGCHRTATGDFVGEVEFEAAAERAGFITPVPGGVGPMTVAFVMVNTIVACEQRHGITPPEELRIFY